MGNVAGPRFQKMAGNTIGFYTIALGAGFLVTGFRVTGKALLIVKCLWVFGQFSVRVMASGASQFSFAILETGTHLQSFCMGGETKT